MAAAEDFSLVITAHCSGPMLDACLESAAKLNPRPREIIVAVDGNDPGVLSAAQRHGFRTVVCQDHPGVSATRNAGAQAASGNIVAFADSDVVVRPDHTASPAVIFSDHPETIAVIGSYDDEPAAHGIISRYRNLLHHYTHQNGSREAQTFWAGCGAVRRMAFLEAGGFDESYRVPSVEDIDLGYRLHAAGHRMRLEPRWQVKHLKQWRFRDLVFTDTFRRALPWSRLLRQQARLDNDLNIDRRSRMSALFVVGAAASFLGGIFWHPCFLAAAAFLVLAVLLNWKFYRFLARRGGWLFAAAAIPLHWVYFLAGMTGFAMAFVVPAGKR